MIRNRPLAFLFRFAFRATIRPGSAAFLAVIMVGLLAAQACNPMLPVLPALPTSESAPATLEATPIPSLPETEIHFHLEIPANTPPEATVYLIVLDEVTGLALNSISYEMELQPASQEGPARYIVTLPFKIGSAVKYRYERQAEGIRVAEHTSAGGPARYRLYHVQGPGTVADVVSRWTDTSFEAPRGRITGQAVDAETNQPLPNILICAGGQQALTKSDGSFLLEGLPPGIHNLVAFALDGSYRTFQQGAQVAAESMTPAEIKLEKAPRISAIFVVRVPADTPPLVPVRLAGSLYGTGNTFANLTGGVSSLATQMPELNKLPDGRYTLTLNLPAGADLRYKYTLGDGFWNAEHRSTGEFQVRQMVVPDHNVLIEETVETWHTSDQQAISFDLTVPENTPAGDTIFIQFNPLFGWTEPIPMWSLGNNRWGYILFSPLTLPGNLSYRYCRNAQCGTADDAQTPGLYGAGRPVNLQELPQAFKENVEAWAAWEGAVPVVELGETTVPAFGADFIAGVELQPVYHPSWQALFPAALAGVKSLGANWVVIIPSWTFTRSQPPVLELVPGQDAMWNENAGLLSLVTNQSLKAALFPTHRFPQPVNIWWQAAPRDFSWWLVWFDQYRTFAIHHADLAARTGASALVLGGEGLGPALPEGTLPDGSSSGVPADSEERWRDLLAEVRARYNGPIWWAIPADALDSPPSFLAEFDGLYVMWTAVEGAPAEPQTLQLEFETLLKEQLYPLYLQSEKQVILAVSAPSQPDMLAQASAYDILLRVMGEQEWISGFVSRGFFPAAALHDGSASVNGKLAGELLRNWFPGLLGAGD